MSTRSPLDHLFTRSTRQRRWLRGALTAGLVVVPLAVTGLFIGARPADDRVDTLPAIVVNNDEMVTTTLPDGTEQPVLAGRQLVTELTKPRGSNADSTGFAWSISNSADARAALASGKAYAVLTVPADFSASVTSLGGDTPTRADLSIRTDDSQSYLAGSVAQSVGTALTGAFGREITAQYLSALYGNLAGLGDSLTEAADGAAKVSTGVTGVATGLDGLAAGTASAAAGAASAASGAAAYSAGVAEYSGGVDSLSAGLGDLSAGAAGLSGVSEGVAGYTGGVAATASAFAELRAALLANPTNEAYRQSLNDFQAGLDGLAAQGGGLSQQTGSAIGGVQGGISQSATGAATLAGGSAGLRSGASELATGVAGVSGGLATLSTGTADAASGARQLETGASALATGLATGAASAAGFADTDAAATAGIVAEPVAVTTQRANPVASIGPILGMVFVPIGLWIGALAIFLLARPLSAVALASTASTGRLMARSLGRAALVASAQAAVVVLLLHGTLGVDWSLLPATLGFALLLGVVFVAVHHWLTAAFGRVGIVLSLVLLALQLTAVGGLFPIELVSGPFQVISPFLPLTWAVSGMQAIVTGGGGTEVASAVTVLVSMALVAGLFGFAAVAGKRGARSFGLSLARS